MKNKKSRKSDEDYKREVRKDEKRDKIAAERKRQGGGPMWIGKRTRYRASTLTSAQ